jgi:hypothetical protein
MVLGRQLGGPRACLGGFGFRLWEGDNVLNRGFRTQAWTLVPTLTALGAVRVAHAAADVQVETLSTISSLTDSEYHRAIDRARYTSTTVIVSPLEAPLINNHIPV